MPQPIDEGQITAHIPNATIAKALFQGTPVNIMVTRKGKSEGEPVPVTILVSHSPGGCTKNGVPVLLLHGKTGDKYFSARYHRLDMKGEPNQNPERGSIKFFASPPPALLAHL